MNRAIVPIGLWLAAVGLGQVPCSPAWSANMFVPNGTNGNLLASVVFDDGTGPALYVGGTFTIAGAAVVSNVAKWNGAVWSDVGGGTNATVRALAVFDDGTGPKLYAGGLFVSAGGNPASHIAKWNGAAWSAVAGGINGDVYAFTTLGSGPTGALVAGGTFGVAGSVFANNVAALINGAWMPIAGGLPVSNSTSGVRSLALFNDGTGLALYAGGAFNPPPFGAHHIWKFNGISWSPVGLGILGTAFGSSAVNALLVHDDGTGPALYAGGDFTVAGGVGANRVARWSGGAWSAVGAGQNGPVEALAVFDDGTGPKLFASGFITGGVSRWDGNAWTTPGAGINGQGWALTVYDDGTGPALFASGNFNGTGTVPARNIAKLTTSWSSLGIDGSLSGTVNALAVFDDGTGPHLFAGGNFSLGASTSLTNIAKWTPAGWIAITTGISGTVLSLGVFDGGGGPYLFVGGAFTSISGVAVTGIAKWNGSVWSGVGNPFNNNIFVNAFAVHDDGSGLALFVGGIFFHAGGVAGASHIAKWDGTTWSAVGVPTQTNGGINGLTVMDDGNGTALFAGGDFTMIGGTSANRVAKWNGTTWSAVGTGVNGTVWTVAPYDSGVGPARLIVGGDFAQAAGVTVNRVAMWNGSGWSGLGAGVDDRVNALRTFDDGAGPRLFAGGLFANAGGAAASRIARWDGTAWSPVGGAVGLPGSTVWVKSLIGFDDGTGPALHAGGQFSGLGGIGSASVGRRMPGGSPIVLTTLLPQIAYPGGGVTFSATASGTHPISYQWNKNGMPISGATGPTYAIAAAAASDAGTYSLSVGNGCGSSASNAVALSILQGLSTYGTSTPGCAGFPWIGATSGSQIGNGAFAVTAANVPPNSQGLCAACLAPAAAPFWVGGLAAWLDPNSLLVMLPVTSDGAGHCTVPAGLANNPALLGFVAYVQMAWPDACAPGGLAATNALRVAIVP